MKAFVEDEREDATEPYGHGDLHAAKKERD
jgi:hypothetical protein